MTTIVEELNKITNEHAETISDAIEDLGEDLDAAGHELPAVDSTDNGKLLGVVNGKWGKVGTEDLSNVLLIH